MTSITELTFAARGVVTSGCACFNTAGRVATAVAVARGGSAKAHSAAV